MNARNLAAAGLLLIQAAGAIAQAGAPARRPIAVADFDRVQHLSDPRVAPDGAWVAYVVTQNDIEADEERSAVWMVSWDGTQRVALTHPANGTEKPRWSPDGRFISYLAAPAGSAKVQVMLLDRRGGDARQLTHVDGEISDYAWSPDGKRLAMIIEQRDEPAKGGSDDAAPDATAAPGDKSPKPIVIEAVHFKQDEDGYLAAGRARHVYLLDVGTRRLEALTLDPRFNESAPAWSPDGRQIAFIRSHEKGADEDGRTDIDAVDARPGALVRTLVRVYAPNQQSLAWSPDGSMIAYLEGAEPRFNAYMQDHLFVVPAVGGMPRPLTAALDRAVMSYVFAEDSKAVTIAVEDDRTIYPARIDMPGGAISRAAAAGPYVVSDLSAAAGHTAVLKADDGAFAEVYALESGGLRKLTGHNDQLLEGLALGVVEDVSFKSSNGVEVHGLLVKPPAFVAGRAYPMLLWIHGGPNGEDEHALVIDGYQFEPQYFAARGFVVLRVNYRGGSGRGGAFARSIAADWGHKEVEDLLAGVDYAVKRGIADPQRLHVGGWSYGGILTDYTIASDRRFKAAISGAGSANQLAFYGADQYILQYNNELGPPWRNTALWLKVSYPFLHADRIHTPTLFLGGDRDFNVPVIGGEQMYEALRTLGVPAQLAVYPDQHHVFTRPSFVRDLAARMSAWLDRWDNPR